MKCCDYDCNQGSNCPDRLDIAIGRTLSVIAGMGFIACCIAAGLLWGVK